MSLSPSDCFSKRIFQIFQPEGAVNPIRITLRHIEPGGSVQVVLTEIAGRCGPEPFLLPPVHRLPRQAREAAAVPSLSRATRSSSPYRQRHWLASNWQPLFRRYCAAAASPRSPRALVVFMCAGPPTSSEKSAGGQGRGRTDPAFHSGASSHSPCVWQTGTGDTPGPARRSHTGPG